MRKNGNISVWLAATTLLVATTAPMAEEAVELPRPLDIRQLQPNPASGVTEPGPRNPFSASGALKQLAMQPKPDPSAPQAGPVFTPKTAIIEQKLPEMRLRGHLRGTNGEMVALLQIGDGNVHIVREGDTVGLYEAGQDTVIRVKQISRLHLVIESGSLDRLIIVR